MVHHLSIPTRDPERAARALAQLLGGEVTPFGPLPGSWIGWAGDEAGTAIDCLPLWRWPRRRAGGRCAATGARSVSSRCGWRTP